MLSAEAWEAAARAIMTTDTFPKGATATATIDGTTVRLNGFAKGSGMIAPDMATMLAYIFTDAALPAAVLQPLLSAATGPSFNSITVDSDTSTSDTVLLCATQQARHAPVTSADDPRLDDFRRALDAVMIDLATADRARRRGRARNSSRSRSAAPRATRRRARIGLSIGNSPLVKTAIAAGDANWGRIVMAVGKAGEKADRDRLSISVGGIRIAAEGGPVPGYDEAPVAEHMAGPRHHDRRRSRHRPRPRDGVDLRPDARLCRHQRQLPELTPRPIRSLVAAVALIDADGRVLLAERPRRQASRRARGNFPAARSSPARRPRRR